MGIAEVLLTRGWVQGVYSNDEGVCLMIAAAMPYKCTADATVAWDVVTQLVGVSRGERAECAITRWNDTPGRTFKEVLRVARMADAKLGL